MDIALGPLFWNVLPHTQYHRQPQRSQLCLVIWVNDMSVPLDTLSMQTASLPNKCRMTQSNRNTYKHPSFPWISIHPSCSGWCPLHLASPAKTPGYESGSRSSSQMVWAFNATCPAFSNLGAAKTRPKPTWHHTSNGERFSPLHTTWQANGWALSKK